MSETDVIKRVIVLHEYRNEYLVALPPVVNMAAIRNSDDMPTKSQIIVAVYRHADYEPFSRKHYYEFVGVEIR